MALSTIKSGIKSTIKVNKIHYQSVANNIITNLIAF